MQTPKQILLEAANDNPGLCFVVTLVNGNIKCRITNGDLQTMLLMRAIFNRNFNKVEAEVLDRVEGET